MTNVLLSHARREEHLNATVAQEGSNSQSSASSSTTNNESSSDNSDSDDFSSNVQDVEVERCVAAALPCCSNSVQENETESNVIVHREDEEATMVVEDNKECCQKSRSRYRHKFDSGLGDELVLPSVTDLISSSSSDEEDKTRKRRKGEKVRKLDFKWKKFDRVEMMERSCDSDDNDIESSSEKEKANSNRNMMYQSLYTVHMRNKIQELPLPSNVKQFLNMYRDV